MCTEIPAIVGVLSSANDLEESREIHTAFLFQSGQVVKSTTMSLLLMNRSYPSAKNHMFHAVTYLVQQRNKEEPVTSHQDANLVCINIFLLFLKKSF